MDTTSYIALAGQVASSNQLAVVTNNTANASTPGFKSDNVLFQKWLYQDAGKKNTMPVDAKTVTDHSQGSLKQTNSQFDFAVVGSGFFALREADGTLRFTRNGRFNVSSEGVLQDVHGRPVLGSDGEAVVFAEGEKDIVVSRNGTIFVNSELRGELGIFSLPSQEAALKTQHGDFIIQGEPELVDMSQTTVIQGMLEASNTDAVMGLVDLAEVSKQVDRNNTVMNANRENVKTSYRVFSE